jgi:cytoskeletal protein CcmA (bactofilin family)
MKRFAVATALATTLAFAPLLAPVSAAKPTDVATQLPVTSTTASAATFTGTLNLTRFANVNGTLTAIGTLTGTLTNTLTGETTTILQNVALPVVAVNGTCSILHLDLGPLHLNLLGLVVDLNRVVLDIVAESGAGNLLGNLLCAVANLLNNPNGLAQLLNQILAAL